MAGATVVGLVTSLLGVWFHPAPAVVIQPFLSSFVGLTNGDIVLRGNSSMTCPEAVSPCPAARDRGGDPANLDNDAYDMVYVDVDSDPSTFNSSSAELTLPAAAEVLFAGLYWGGDTSTPIGGTAPPAPDRRNEVRLTVPGGSPATVVASRLPVLDDPLNPGVGPYQGFADVTGQVAAAGNGTYTVADIQSAQGRNRYAGWALVVAYRDPALPVRVMVVQDGFASLTPELGNDRVTIPVTGLVTPETGTVQARLGLVVYDGDAGQSGEGVAIGPNSLSDAQNPFDNLFNSTISELGASPPRQPASANTFGVDIDLLDAGGAIPNGAVDASITVATGADTIQLGLVTLAVDAPTPNLETTKSVVDLNGGDVAPGDVLEVQMTVNNTGVDAALGAVVTDTVPNNTTYVADSLRIDDVAQTDAIDLDQAEMAGDLGLATFRVGAGADGLTGGQLDVGASTTMAFQVQVSEDAANLSEIVNTAVVTSTGATTGVPLTGASNTSTLSVSAPRTDLVMTKTADVTAVTIGTAPRVTWTLTVVNNGPLPDPAVTLTDVVPDGFDIVSATPDQGTCTTTAPTVSCDLGALDPGPTVTVTVVADATDTASDPATNTAQVQGLLEDAAPADNQATATVAVNRNPVAADDSATTGPASPVVVAVTANDTDPDAGDTLTVTVSAPTGGTAVANPDGTVTYTPDAGFAGPDTFTYTVSDGRGGTDSATVTVTVDNAAPTAGGDNASTGSETPVTIDVLANDTDANGDPLTVTAVSTPTQGGSVVINPDGTLTYTPPPGFSGLDTFTYTVSDGNGGTTTATVQVEVWAPPPNAPPTALDDAATTPYATAVTVAVLANDSDPEGDPVAVVPNSLTVPVDAGGTSRGTAALNPDGTVTYTPPAGFSGVVTFDYSAADDQGLTDTATVTVTVSNAAPVAGDDPGVETTVDRPVTIAVLGNDRDPNGDPLAISAVGTPGAGGTVVVNADGTLTYTPPAGFAGTDTFTYTVSDGNGGTDTATVTVTVPNAPPVAADDGRTTTIGAAVTIPVLGNDTDPNPADVLTVTAAGPATDPAGAEVGTVTVGGDGTLTYTPPDGFEGTVTFPYTVSDGNGGTATATATVTVVNAPPEANDDAAVADPATATTVAVVANDTDPNGDPLTIVATTSPARGTVTFDAAAGTVTYTPQPGFSGTDLFTYTVSDGRGANATATVTVTVRNAAPSAAPDSATTGRDAAVVVDVLANDTDANGDPLAISAFTATSTAGGSVGRDDRGTPDTSDDRLVYTPPAGFTGTDTFTYTVTDGEGGSATTTVTVDVPNGAPTANPDTATVPTGGSVVIAVAGNDTDPDGDPLTTTGVVDEPPPDGTAVVNADGTVTYTPNPGFAGADAFTYTVSDGRGGTATGTVTVTVANGEPVVADDRVGTASTAPVTIPVLANDADPNGDPLTVTGVSTPAGGGTAVVNPDGTLTYTPPPRYAGTDTFTYTVSDGNGGTGTATVTVDVSNAAPVVGDDTVAATGGGPVTVPVLANDLDPDGGPLTITAVSDSAAGGRVTINPDGTVTYTPPAGYAGTDTFTYTVSDGAGGTATGTVTVTVANSAPTAGDDSAVTTPGEAVVVAVLANDSDANGDPLTVTGLTPPASGGTVSLNPDGTVTYTPAPGYAGPDTFTYTVSDGAGGTATATVTVDVANQAPVVADDRAVGSGGGPVAVDVLANDSDPDGDPLTVVGVADPANGTVTVGADGLVRYTPDPGFTGTDTFTYTAGDGRGGTTDATVTVEIRNAAPTAADDGAGTTGGQAVTVDVLANDTDPNGQPLTLEGIVTPPAGGTVTVNADGTLTYTPDPGFEGTDTFEYQVTDGSGGYDTAVVSVGVSNDHPVAVADTAATDHHTPVVVAVLTNDFDPNPGDTVTVVPDSLSPPRDPDGRVRGTVVLNPDGTVTYSPPPGFAGTVTFDYAVTDGEDATPSDSATVTVTVRDAPPVAGDDTATVTEGGSVAVAVLANDSDPNGDPLRIVGVGPARHGVVVVDDNGTPDDPSDDRLVYRPTPGFVGTDTVTYTVSDGRGGTATATVTFTVEPPPNAGPRFSADPDNTTQSVPTGRKPFSLVAVDPDGDTLTYRVIGGDLPGGVTLRPDGTWIGTPVVPGVFRPVVEACDASGACTRTTLTLTVRTPTDLTREPDSNDDPGQGPTTARPLPRSGGFGIDTLSGLGLALLGGGVLCGAAAAAWTRRRPG